MREDAKPGLFRRLAEKMNCIDPMFYTTEILEDAMYCTYSWSRLREWPDCNYRNCRFKKIIVSSDKAIAADVLMMKKAGTFHRFRELLEEAASSPILQKTRSWLEDTEQLMRAEPIEDKLLKCAKFIDEIVEVE